MADDDTPDPDRGLDFLPVEARVSTTATARAVVAAAAARFDPDLAAAARSARDWRADYLGPFRRLVEAGARSPEAAVGISRDGLAAAHEAFGFVRGGSTRPLADVAAVPSGRPLATVQVRGAEVPEPTLSVPYRGRRLEGSDLHRQLDRWVEAGIAEPSFRDAVGAVVDAPGWLDLRGTTVVVIGAGAEMGPLRSLLRWGAHVVALDLPRPDVWRRVLATAREGAGVLSVPVPEGRFRPDDRPDDESVAAVAGVDLVRELPEVATWLSSFETERLVLGMYAYADSAAHVRLSMAADVLALDAIAQRGAQGVVLAYLATPTDVYAVPFDCVRMARERWDDRRTRRVLQAPLRLARMYEPAYRSTVTDIAGREVGIADILVPQQGPNYAFAKRLQRWRAVLARDEGTTVSLNVAPATRTRSVVKNRALAAAYAGAGRFGIEVFDPSTSNTLMAALLVRDLRDPSSAAAPTTPLANPLDLFSDAANHGGLWRSAYEPRSVLGVAALLGMFERRA